MPVRSSPQALKRKHIFNGLAVRLELVPFPFPGEGDLFRSLLSRCPIAPFRVR